MGIRFYCPNGHKLNVKAFQAGRRGVCPYCGEKTQIPTQSTRPSRKQAKDSDAQAPAPEAIRSTTEPASLEVPMAELASAVPVATPEAQAKTEKSVPKISPQPIVPSVVAPSVASPVLPDPLLEEPNAVWYVRPSAGGQFGPATSDVMRSWLGDGRVTDDSLVWREGWRDWEEASAVFPQLAANRLPTINQATSAVGPNVTVDLPSASGLTDSSTPATLTYRKASRRRSNITATVVIAGLALAVIVLVVALIWVIGSQNGQPEPDAQSARFEPVMERAVVIT